MLSFFLLVTVLFLLPKTIKVIGKTLKGPGDWLITTVLEPSVDRFINAVDGVANRVGITMPQTFWEVKICEGLAMLIVLIVAIAIDPFL